MVLVTAVPRPWLGLQVNNEIKETDGEISIILIKLTGVSCKA